MAGIEHSRWHALSPLLDELLDADAAHCAARIEQIRGENGALADDLVALLAQRGDVETAAFLEGSALGLAEVASLAEQKVGSYTLERLLGQGGMGAVWLARRSDGRFEGKAAVKFLNLALLGGSGAERFRREGSVLARLAHPNIARLLDAGVAAGGQPYLVLEYVDGEPIDQWCKTRALDTNARLRLFLDVLAAVAHAHNNLILHRDLKPANILVTADGHVRLLDFGIAKFLEDGGDGAMPVTEVGDRALTLDYAAPEQILGESLTVATDVYALGVVLYDLLTGSRPYKVKRDTRRALEDAIIASEPPPPSTAVTNRALRRELAGDLDTIVLKALKKGLAERYATVGALADDVRRYLAGAPVLARADSTWYRARKLLGRHKLTASAAAAALLAVIIGGAVALWQANTAREQARLARQEALRAQTVQRFLLDIFKTNSDQQADPLKARTTTARELLDIGARRAAETLKDAPEVQDEVLQTLADMYAQMRLNDSAVQLRRQQIDALKRAHGARDRRVVDAMLMLAADISNTRYRDELPQLLGEIEQVLDAAGDRSSAERGALLIEQANYFRYRSLAQMRTYADQALALLRSNHPEQSGLLLHALDKAGLARFLADDALGAEALFREQIDTARQRFPKAAAWQILPLVRLAETQAQLARVDDAEASFRRALEMSKQTWGEFNPDALQTQAKLGAFLHATGRRAEGNALLLAARGALGRTPGNDTPNAVDAINFALGTSSTADGRFEEALKFISADADDSRQRDRRLQPSVRTLIAQAELAMARGHYDQAHAALDEADATWRDFAPDLRGPSANRLLFARARLLLAEQRATDALPVLEAMTPPTFGAATPLVTDEVTARLLRGHAHLLLGHTEEAKAEAQAALDAIQRSPVRAYFVDLQADATLLLGQALRRQADPAEACTQLERALKLRETNHDPNSPWLAQAQIEFAGCLLDLRKRPEAQRLLAQARAIHAKQAQLGAQFTEPLHDLQARLLQAGAVK
jgi:serine/threonine-protein kinase